MISFSQELFYKRRRKNGILCIQKEFSAVRNIVIRLDHLLSKERSVLIVKNDKVQTEGNDRFLRVDTINQYNSEKSPKIYSESLTLHETYFRGMT